MMKDIERRIALLDIKDELAKTLEPCPCRLVPRSLYTLRGDGGRGTER